MENKLLQFRPGKDVSDFQLNDELVLFAESSGRLFRANATAALIWQAIRSGLDREEITALLAEAYSHTKDTIASDLDAVLLQWQANGLLGTPEATARYSATDELPPPVHAKPFWPPDHETLNSYYQILDCRIVLQLPGKAEAQKVHPVLAHLSAPGRIDPNVVLEVCQSKDQYVMLYNGVPMDWCEDDQGLAPMVHSNLVGLVYDHTDCLTGFHAAAVMFEGACALMPANSGNGKSTLTSALVGSGFQYGSDDMALLTRHTVKLRPVPISMGLKKGSWDLLTPYYPHLKELPIHVRNDHKAIRYLPPPNDFITDPSARIAITHIVFPKYHPGSLPMLNPIGQAEALCRIAEAGFDVHGGLTTARVQKLVDWIAKIPCYEFVYSHLEEAVGAIKDTLRRP